MTAALTGRPLLAMLFLAYLALVAFVGERDATEPWEADPEPVWKPCGDPACCPPRRAS